MVNTFDVKGGDLQQWIGFQEGSHVRANKENASAASCFLAASALPPEDCGPLPERAIIV